MLAATMHAAPPPTNAAPADGAARLAEATRAHEAGRLDEAKAAYLAALAHASDLPEAEHGLGWLLVQQGDWRAALPRFARAIALRPWEPEFWISQIEALIQLGQREAVHRILHRARLSGLPQAAAERFEKRLQELRLAPLAAQARALGLDARRASVAPQSELLAMREAFLGKRYAEARSNAESVVRRFPLCPFAWRVLGASLPGSESGTDAGLEVLRIACDLDPRNVDVRMNLALALHECGRLDEAGVLYGTVLEAQPDNVRALVNHALLLTARRDPAAEAQLRRARELGSKDHRVALALGGYLRDRERFAEAAPLLKEVLAREPDNVTAVAALSVCCLSLGRHDDAAALFHRLNALDCEHFGALGIALFVGAHLEALPPEQLFRIHQRFGALIEARITPMAGHANSRDPDRRLRVGFVSGDFNDHAIAHFLLPVWRHLGKERIALYGYAASSKRDAVTEAFQALTEGWHDAVGQSDELLAERIRRDGIDVLFDLSGHTAFHRLGAFAHKPAPVQISWCGYPGTTGLTRMDYFLADTTFSPPGMLEAQFTEKLLLPWASSAFAEEPDLPEVVPPPASRGLPFTFGSFNRVSKLTPQTLALWAEVLRAAPAARLCVGGIADGDQAWLREAFERLGVAPERLSFLPRSGKRAYLEAHGQIDLLLDALPYSGGTTTAHGVWMGVPTLTLAGRTLAGRQSLNTLGHCGLEAFIAADREAFIAAAVGWTQRVDELAALRAGMRDRLRHSSIGQPELAAEAVADAIRAAWRRWCEGLPPETLVVPRRVPPG